MSFANLDMTSYASSELSGRRRSAGGPSLPDRMEATMRVIMYMANIATDENARMGRKVLCRGGMRWGQQFHRVKDGIGHVYVINENVVETESCEEELIRRFNADLMRLGGAGRMNVMKLKERGSTRQAGKQTGPLPEPCFLETARWLQLIPLHTRAEYG